MINSDTLRKFANKGKPFVIYLADGRSIAVPHGEHIAVRPDGREFLLWEPDGGFEIFSRALVTSIRREGKKKANPS